MVMILFISCKQESPKNVEWSDLLITYIEARTDKGDGAGSYGDVVVYDVGTNTKYQITDDSYNDRDPAISPDKRYVAFMSSRRGSRLARDLRGVSLPHELYIFDRKANKTTEFDTRQLANDGSVRDGAFSCLAFSPDNRWLVAGTYDGYILRFSLDGQLGDTLLSIPHSRYVSQVTYSPNGYLLGVTYLLDSLSLVAVAIYNEKDKGLRHVFVDLAHAHMAWMPNGNEIMYHQWKDPRFKHQELMPERTGYYSYNYVLDSSFPRPDLDERLAGKVLLDAAFLMNMNIVGNGCLTEDGEHYQVFRITPDDSLRWLTSGHGITDLSVYLPPLTGEKH